MKTLLNIIIFLYLPLLLIAQDSKITGRLLDINQDPVIGANVYLTGTILGSSTDAKGEFSILNVPAGKFTLTIAMIGYQQKDTTLNISSGDLINIGTIILTDIPLQSQPIVVTASKYEQNIQDIPLSISTISAQEINYRNSTRVDEALKYVSGVNMNRDQVNIRGSNGYSYGTGSRVMLLIDGVPYITGDTQGLIFESIPVNKIERVEVQKGAGSALYGSNALGGVINVLTKPINDKREINVKLYGGLYDSPYYEEWEWSENTRYMHGLRIDYSQKIKSTGIMLSMSRDEDDNHKKNAWNLRYNISGKLEFDISSFDLLTVSGNYMDQRRENFLYWKDLNNALLPSDDQLGDRISTQRYYIASTYRKILHDKQYYKLSVIWNHNSFTDNIGVSGNHSNSEYANLEFQYNISVDKHFFTFGITPTFNAVSSDIFGSRKGQSIAGYVQDEINFDEKWQISPGLRFDYYDLEDLGRNTSVNPKFGVVFKPKNGTAVRASLGSGFRAPSVAEAFSSTTAGGLTVKPNPDLKPESSISAEIGWNQFYSTNMFADAAVFYNYFWDLIEGQFITVEEANYIRFDNVTEARIFGVEINYNWQIIPNKFLYHFGYTYINSKDIATGETLKYRPEHLFYTDGKYRLGSVWIGVDYRYISRFDEIDDTFAKIIQDADARVPVHVLDLRFMTDFKLSSLPLTISFQINNILQYNSADLIGALSPIRNYVLTMETNL